MGAICVIDDDDDFRALIGEYLASLGYPVLEFASAEEALGSLLAASPPPLQLVISDTKMARLTGLELVEELRRARPALPIILMSAFGPRESEERAIAAGATAYIDKPFPLPTLKDLVGRVLNELTPTG